MDATDWHEYEARKAAISKIGLTCDEYEAAIRRLCDELRI